MVATSPELETFLVNSPLFGGLAGESLDRLIAMLAERQFDPGAVVVSEGEEGRSLFIVRSGQLAVRKRGENGSVIELTRLGPGDFFGEMTLIEIQARSATLVAETSAVLYELTARDLYAYYKADLRAYAMVLQNMNRELCRRLRRADGRIAELTDFARAPALLPAEETRERS